MNCSQLYVGATRELSEIESEFLAVERLPPSDSEFEALSSVLEVPNLYYLASHSACGCGWEYTGSGTEWDQRNLSSRNALEAYLRVEVASGPILLMSVCVDALGNRPPAWERRSVDELFAEFNGWRVLYSSNDVRVAVVRS